MQIYRDFHLNVGHNLNRLYLVIISFYITEAMTAG